MVGEQLRRGPAGSDDFVMPAEVEPHAAIWMGWPKEQWYTDSALDTRPPIAGIMAVLAAHGIDVQLMCTDQAGELRVKEGEVADEGMMLGMNWYVQGVDDQLPQ